MCSREEDYVAIRDLFESRLLRRAYGVPVIHAAIDEVHYSERQHYILQALGAYRPAPAATRHPHLTLLFDDADGVRSASPQAAAPSAIFFAATYTPATEAAEPRLRAVLSKAAAGLADICGISEQPFTVAWKLQKALGRAIAY